MDENEGRKYSKMYWWLKLQEDFFDTKEMKKLRRIAGGAVYQLIYLKMQLIAMKNCGRIYFDGIEETFADEIALTLDETPEDVQATLVLLERMGLAKKMNDDTLYLPEAEKNTGSETKWAGKKREYRKAIAAKNAKAIKDKKAVKKDNPRTSKGQCPTEIESELEIESEISLAGDNSAPAHACEEEPQAFGTYKNVFLTVSEIEQLQNELPDCWEEIAQRLSTYKKQTGKSYSSDFATIRRWAEEDADIINEMIDQLRPKRGSCGKSNTFSTYDGQREYTPEEYDELELAMRKRRAGAESEGEE